MRKNNPMIIGGVAAGVVASIVIASSIISSVSKSNKIETTPQAPQNSTSPIEETEKPTTNSAPSRPERQQTSTGQTISRSDAKKIALSDAGLEENEVRRFVATFDTEDGQPVYDIDFYSIDGYTKFEYTIRINDGEILKREKESLLHPFED